MRDFLSFLIIPASLLLFLFAFLSPSRPAALLGAGIGIVMSAVMSRRIAVVMVLILIVLSMTACSGDPLGLVAAEHERTIAQVQIAQVQADAATNQARIEASTARVRVGGWMTAALIGGIVIVLCVVVAGTVHLQAQRDRLSAEQWRAALPPQHMPATLPRRKPAHWLALSRPAPPMQVSGTLALPARSESAHDVVVIDG